MIQKDQTTFRLICAKTFGAERSGNIQYGEHDSASLLRMHVACIWTLRSVKPLGEVIPHRVIPDTCMDLIFHRKSPTGIYKSSFVGTMTRPMWVPLYGQEDYIGIRFRPGGIRYFLDVPVQDLTDRVIPAETIIGQMASQLTEWLAEARSRVQISALLEGFLTDHLKADLQDETVEEAIRYILHRSPNVAISRLAGMTGYSERHLRRRFKEAVGVSPKTLDRIVRFRTVCQALTQGERTDSVGAALDCGYYDQAHFIREFKAFYGDTPSVFLQHRTA